MTGTEPPITELIPYLYQLVFVIGLAGYLPQLYNLLKTHTQARSMSLITWTIWSSSWAISLLYGVYYLQDAKFCAVATMNLVGHGAVIGLTLYNRHWYGRNDQLMALSHKAHRRAP